VVGCEKLLEYFPSALFGVGDLLTSGWLEESEEEAEGNGEWSGEEQLRITGTGGTEGEQGANAHNRRQ